VDESIVLIIELLAGELGFFGDIDIAMEGKSSVESIAVLTATDVSSQDRIWCPAFAVKERIVGSKSTCFCLRFGGLQVFIGGSVARITGHFGIFEGRVRGSFPISL